MCVLFLGRDVTFLFWLHMELHIIFFWSLAVSIIFCFSAPLLRNSLHCGVEFCLESRGLLVLDCKLCASSDLIDDFIFFQVLTSSNLFKTVEANHGAPRSSVEG